jgi:succinate-semialdehyde dehydrogenase/glutarate-semialdehyde dehydrogenase
VADGGAPALKVEDLLRGQGLIGGQWTDGGSGRRFEVTDPATDRVVGTLPRMGADETSAAIDAAVGSFEPWRDTPAQERSAILRRWFELMEANVDDLAAIITAEQGKPLAEARGEILYAASFFDWFAGQGRRAYGEQIPTPSDDRRLFATKDAIGVGACITPWNFPAAMITRKAGAALAVGCPVVMKPAEQAPLTGLAIAWLGTEAGLPDGVINVLTGSEADAPVIGETITSSKAVRAISFTGSTMVGKLLLRQSADTVKKVSLELGGNAPLLVFDDADIAQAVRGTVGSAFRNAGQTCVSARRILVHDSIFEEFRDRLIEAVEALKVGPGIDPSSDLGPLIDDAAYQKVERHVEDAVSKGAEVLTGGKPHPRGGRFWSPTVLTGVNGEMDVAEEETFGPVIYLASFSDETEAIAKANQYDSGLAAFAYTKDSARQWRLVSRIESGVLGINEGVVATATAPFGGVKESGLGREGAHEGIEEWLETKYVCLAGL